MAATTSHPHTLLHSTVDSMPDGLCSLVSLSDLWPEDQHDQSPLSMLFEGILADTSGPDSPSVYSPTSSDRPGSLFPYSPNVSPAWTDASGEYEALYSATPSSSSFPMTPPSTDENRLASGTSSDCFPHTPPPFEKPPSGCKGEKRRVTRVLDETLAEIKGYTSWEDSMLFASCFPSSSSVHGQGRETKLGKLRLERQDRGFSSVYSPSPTVSCQMRGLALTEVSEEGKPKRPPRPPQRADLDQDGENLTLRSCRKSPREYLRPCFVRTDQVDTAEDRRTSWPKDLGRGAQMKPESRVTRDSMTSDRSYFSARSQVEVDSAELHDDNEISKPRRSACAGRKTDAASPPREQRIEEVSARTPLIPPSEAFSPAQRADVSQGGMARKTSLLRKISLTLRRKDASKDTLLTNRWVEGGPTDYAAPVTDRFALNPLNKDQSRSECSPSTRPGGDSSSCSRSCSQSLARMYPPSTMTVRRLASFSRPPAVSSATTGVSMTTEKSGMGINTSHQPLGNGERGLRRRNSRSTIVHSTSIPFSSVTHRTNRPKQPGTSTDAEQCGLSRNPSRGVPSKSEWIAKKVTFTQ